MTPVAHVVVLVTYLLTESGKHMLWPVPTTIALCWLADSLAATSNGANARHHQPDFRNQSDMALYTADGACNFPIGQITSDGAR